MSVISLNGRSRTPLELSPPEGELDPTVSRSLAALAAADRYAKATRQADKLVRDEGLTLDIERLRDRVERRFAGAERLLLAQPGVLHRLLLDALEADDLRKASTDRDKERREREKKRADEAAARLALRQEEARQSRQVNEALMQALADVIASNREIVSSSQAMLKSILSQDSDDSPPDGTGKAAQRRSRRTAKDEETGDE